jgi:hypothetical protein
MAREEASAEQSPFVENAFTRMSRLERLLLAQGLLADELARAGNPLAAKLSLGLAYEHCLRAVRLGAARGPTEEPHG